MVTVGPFPSQLLWNVDAAQPSVLACQHLTNLLRPVVWSTGSKYEFNLPRYLLPWLSRMLDELRAPKTKVVHIDEKVTHSVDWNLQSLRLILFNSFAPFTTPSRANTYINLRYLILENLFMQPHHTTEKGKYCLREKMSTLGSTFCDRLNNNLKSRVRDKENAL